MKPALIEKGIPLLAALTGVALLALWGRSYWHGPPVPERPMNVDRRPVPAAPTPTGPAGPSTLPTLPGGSAPAAAAGAPVAAPTGAPAAQPAAIVAGEWPGFRGPRRDNILTGGPALARQWGPQGPPQLWSAALGEGYAAPAVRAGRVYVLDYDQGAQADTLRCFSLADGAELWRRAYPNTVKRNHGMSRTVPAVTDKYVVTLGPKCHLMCTDPVSGKVHWIKDLVAEFGAAVPEWYAGQCPLVDGDRIIVAPGGSAIMAALDARTGRVLWRTPNPGNWEMTHSSIMPVTLRGRRMYVYCGSGGVVGVDARTGARLWETGEWTINTATVPSPLQVGDGRILLTGGYNSGAMLLQLEDQGGRITPRIVLRMQPTQCGSDQQTPVFYKGHIYCVLPSGMLACIDVNGKQLWTSGAEHRFGMGPYAIADGVLFLMNDTGVLTMVDPSPSGYRQLAEARVMEGTECWGPLAIAGGRLLARDLTRMVCLDVSRRN